MSFRNVLMVLMSILGLNLTACAAAPPVIKTGDQQDASQCDDVPDRDLRETCFREELKATRTSLAAAQRARKERAKPPSDDVQRDYNPLPSLGGQAAPPPPMQYVAVGMRPLYLGGPCIPGYDFVVENDASTGELLEVQGNGILPCGGFGLISLPTSNGVNVTLIELEKSGRFTNPGYGAFGVKVRGFHRTVINALTRELGAVPTGHTLDIYFPGQHPGKVDHWYRRVVGATYGGLT